GSVAFSLSLTNFRSAVCSGQGPSSARATATAPPSVRASGSAGANASPRPRSASVDLEIGEPIGERGRKSRANENPPLAILALEVTSDLVKLRKTLTGGKGYEQLHFGEPVPDRLGDPLLHLLESLAGLGGDEDRVGVPRGKVRPLPGS